MVKEEKISSSERREGGHARKRRQDESMPPGSFFNRLVRKKTIVTSTLQDTKLRRCLGLMELTGLGLGSSLGLGVYVITSYAIKNDAGPSFVISVIVAGVAALFSGLCYAEFSARLPRAGASYLYSYATLGELCAFVVGWNMILENIIGAAAAAKAWSQYFDFMLNGTVSRFLEDAMKLPATSVTTEYPDLLGCVLLLILTLGVASGSKISSRVNLLLVFINILIILCFVCVGYFHVEHENWTDPPGFFAHGFPGVLAGAAVIFYAFSNFETIASAAEEAKEPSKTVPSAIMLTVFISSAIYFCVSTSITLSLHSSELGATVSLPKLLESLHIRGASTIVSLGAILGLCSTCFGALFCLPRLLYSMANDGLLCGMFGKISKKTDIPIYSALISGTISALVTLFVKLEILIQLLSLGVLLSYTMVSISIICIRYQNGMLGLFLEYEDPNELDPVQCTHFSYLDYEVHNTMYQFENKNTPCKCPTDSTLISEINRKRCATNSLNGYNRSSDDVFDNNYQFNEIPKHHVTPASRLVAAPGNTYKRFDSVISNTPTGSVTGLFRMPSDSLIDPNETTWRKATMGLLMFILCALLMCVATLYGGKIIDLNDMWTIGITLVLVICLIAASVLIARQPQNNTKLFFRTPYVPFVPLVSILLNVYLIASLPELCWLRLITWLTVGLVVYFTYSYKHSREREYDEQEVVLYEITDNETEVRPTG